MSVNTTVALVPVVVTAMLAIETPLPLTDQRRIGQGRHVQADSVLEVDCNLAGAGAIHHGRDDWSDGADDQGLGGRQRHRRARATATAVNRLDTDLVTIVRQCPRSQRPGAIGIGEPESDGRGGVVQALGDDDDEGSPFVLPLKVGVLSLVMKSVPEAPVSLAGSSTRSRSHR